MNISLFSRNKEVSDLKSHCDNLQKALMDKQHEHKMTKLCLEGFIAEEAETKQRIE